MCAHVRFPTLSSGSENHTSAPKKRGWVPWFCRENPLLDLRQVPHSVEAWGPKSQIWLYKIPMCWLSCGFPLVSLWFSDGFPLGNLWFPGCFPMISYGFPMVFLWFPMGSLWFPMVFLVKLPYFPKILQDFSRGEAKELLKRFEEAKKLIQDLGDWDTAETSDLQLLKSSLF